MVSASGSSGPAGLCPTRGADSGSLLLAAGVLTINKWGGGGLVELEPVYAFGTVLLCTNCYLSNYLSS